MLTRTDLGALLTIVFVAEVIAGVAAIAAAIAGTAHGLRNRHTQVK